MSEPLPPGVSDLLLAHASDAVFVHPPEGGYEWANPAALALVGCTLEELRARRVEDFLLPDDRVLLPFSRSELGSGGTLCAVRRIVPLAGEPVEVEIAASALPDGRHVSVVRRTTGRLTAIRKMERERAFMAKVLDMVLSLVIVMDRDGRVVVFNRALETTTGWPAEEVLGEHYRIILPEEEVPRVEAELARVIRERPGVSTFENHLRTRDGRLRLVSWSNSTLLDEEGRVAFLISTGLDVTERARMDEEVRKIQRLESLSLLAGGIAHDFNNLLMGVVGNLSVARALPPDAPPVPAALERAEGAARNAVGLSRQLLAFARGGAPRSAAIDLGALLREEVEFCLRGAAVAAELEVAPGLPAVEGDEGQLRQVFQNLLVNARQVTPAGARVRVRAVCLREGQGAIVRVTVADDGPGVPADVRERVFDPFFSTRPGGTGLGLAVAHSVVRRHDGVIRLLPAGERGAVFEVDLPARGAPVPAGGRRAGPGAEGRWEGRALVMDDEPYAREALAEMLRHLGFDVLETMEGAAALAACRAEPFAIVVADVTVPGGMGGVELARQIAADGIPTPVVLASGYTESPQLARTGEQGLAAVLGKPCSLDAVRDAVRRAIGPPTSG